MQRDDAHSTPIKKTFTRTRQVFESRPSPQPPMPAHLMMRLVSDFRYEEKGPSKSIAQADKPTNTGIADGTPYNLTHS